MIPYIDNSDPFPPVENALPNGLLAYGADLSVKRLLDAYSNGIFPWFSEGDPTLWWSPNPRFVLFPDELHVSKSMKKLFAKQAFKVTFDTDFCTVIRACATIHRKGQDSTWITTNMQSAYCALHDAGYAHSVEVWDVSGELAGGLYGVSLGRMFCGESMFSLQSNASKYGFITLVRWLIERNFELIDAQVYTSHLETLGARSIPGSEFLSYIAKAQLKPTLRGKWSFI